MALFIAGPACAQVSGSVTLLSDDRYHGQSLTDGGPGAQLALAWDRGDGWYTGLQLSHVRFSDADADSGAQLRIAPYVGFVHALRPGLSAEAGVQYNRFSTSRHYDYAEMYIGLSGERVRSRLSWMPRYFGQAAAGYAEVDGNQPLHGRLRAVGHVGALRFRHAEGYSRPANPWQVDIAAGLGITVRGFDAQATWTTVLGASRGHAPCEAWQCGGHGGWVLRLSHGW
ncbi:MAG: hypothetical protein JWL98_402 [Xanthomonadaceae bacterium]|nr:hypothetical protein [Xanthomonadaceae bacterium]